VSVNGRCQKHGKGKETYETKRWRENIFHKWLSIEAGSAINRTNSCTTVADLRHLIIPA
jgi:hypothetical protein